MPKIITVTIRYRLPGQPANRPTLVWSDTYRTNFAGEVLLHAGHAFFSQEPSASISSVGTSWGDDSTL